MQQARSYLGTCQGEWTDRQYRCRWHHILPLAIPRPFEFSEVMSFIWPGCLSLIEAGIQEEGPKEPSSEWDLAVQVFNPPGRLRIADFSKIPLCGGEIGMPQNHFANYLNRYAGSRSISGGMSSEIVGSQLDVDQLAGLVDHHPRRRICDRNDLLIRLNVFQSDVHSETLTVSDLLQCDHEIYRGCSRRTQSYFLPEFILWYSGYELMAWLSSMTFSLLAGY
jgi:hypothetical protein